MKIVLIDADCNKVGEHDITDLIWRTDLDTVSSKSVIKIIVDQPGRAPLSVLFVTSKNKVVAHGQVAHLNVDGVRPGETVQVAPGDLTLV